MHTSLTRMPRPDFAARVTGRLLSTIIWASMRISSLSTMPSSGTSGLASTTFATTGKPTDEIR